MVQRRGTLGIRINMHTALKERKRRTLSRRLSLPLWKYRASLYLLGGQILPLLQSYVAFFSLPRVPLRLYLFSAGPKGHESIAQASARLQPGLSFLSDPALKGPQEIVRPDGGIPRAPSGQDAIKRFPRVNPGLCFDGRSGPAGDPVPRRGSRSQPGVSVSGWKSFASSRAPCCPNAFVWHLAQHHYLGFEGAAGQNLRYLLRDCYGRDLACVLFAAAAWKVQARDALIGCSAAQRQQRLSLIINNSR